MKTDIRREIILIDSRITKLKRTGRIYFQDHGIVHGGIEKLTQELVEKRNELSKQLIRKPR